MQSFYKSLYGMHIPSEFICDTCIFFFHFLDYFQKIQYTEFRYLTN